MGSFLRYNEILFQFSWNIRNNLNFIEKSEICIFFKKIEEFVTIPHNTFCINRFL